MGKAKFQIERRCEVCGNPFFAKTLESRYCSEKCGQVAYTRRKREAKKLKKLQELTEKMDDDRDYITVPEAVAMYSVSRTSLYQYIHDGRIPSINLGVRLIRVSRKELLRADSSGHHPGKSRGAGRSGVRIRGAHPQRIML